MTEIKRERDEANEGSANTYLNKFDLSSNCHELIELWKRHKWKVMSLKEVSGEGNGEIF